MTKPERRLTSVSGGPIGERARTWHGASPGPDGTDLPDPNAPTPSPRRNTGTVFVMEDRPGIWTASWQSGKCIRDIEGTRDVVFAWAQAQPSLKKLIFDPSGNDYVAFS